MLHVRIIAQDVRPWCAISSQFTNTYKQQRCLMKLTNTLDTNDNFWYALCATRCIFAGEGNRNHKAQKEALVEIYQYLEIGALVVLDELRLTLIASAGSTLSAKENATLAGLCKTQGKVTGRHSSYMPFK